MAINKNHNFVHPEAIFCGGPGRGRRDRIVGLSFFYKASETIERLLNRDSVNLSKPCPFGEMEEEPRSQRRFACSTFSGYPQYWGTWISKPFAEDIFHRLALRGMPRYKPVPQFRPFHSFDKFAQTRLCGCPSANELEKSILRHKSTASFDDPVRVICR